MRVGTQPGGMTRLVIETTTRPSYSLDYPTDPNRLVVTISNTTGDASVKASMADGTLVTSLSQSESGSRLIITANLAKSIARIPKSQTMVLEPNGDTNYRLVLDFVAGTGAPAAAAAIAANTPAAVKVNTFKPVIVIDAGHGGKDPGCVGKTGVQEKDIVLSVAKKLKPKLTAAGYTVYLTRDTDIFLNLNTRADIAEQRKANLFISLHANANPSRDMKGFSVYTLSSKASDAEAQKLADAENAADRISVDGFAKYEPNIQIALSAIQRHGVDTSSAEFANCAVKKFNSAGIEEQPGPALRQAGFAVLKSTIPSALIELGHLTNAAEEKQLNSSAHQEKLAESILRAVQTYDFTE